MQELIKHKYYNLILFGIKSLIVIIAVLLFLFVMEKNAGTPFTVEKLSKIFLEKEYSLEFENQNDPKLIEKNFKIKENNDSVILQNAVISYMDSSGDRYHSVADNMDNQTYKDMKNKICKAYNKECKVISFEGSFTDEEKYIYTLLSVFFMNKIDQNLKNSGRTLFDEFHKLKLRANLSKDKSEGECYTSRRGCADHNSLMMNLELVETPEEYANTLVHELSHIVDLGVVVGSSNKKNKIFTEFGKPAFALDDPSIIFYSTSWKGEKTRRKGAKKEDFVSLYGMTNPFEDIAEAGIAYKNHNAYFRVLAQTNRSLYKKYQRWSNIYKGKYIFPDGKNALSIKKETDKRVRDMTKL